MPQVSIIVPCYNQAQYLDECLNSVSNQTFTHWECIIVDDGSPDNTEQVAQNWVKKDSRFIYLKKQNGGLSSARNAGIKTSNGAFILPLDSDDFLAITFLEKTISLLISDNKIGAVGTYVQNFGAQNFVWKCKGGKLLDYLNENQSTTTCLYRKTIFEQIDGYDESMKKGMEDWDFWIRFTSLNYDIHIIEESLFFYRKKKESMLVDTMKNFNEVTNYITQKNQKLFIENFSELIIIKNKQILALTNDKYYYERLIKNLEKSVLFKALRYVMYKLGKL